MKKTLLVTALSSAILLSGCGEQNQGQKHMPASLVVTEQASVIPYQQSKSYIGRVEAVEDTNITAQVTGYLKSRHFEEGQMVEKGQLLFTIEPSSFEAQVASAKAALAQANAELKKAELDFQRGKNLLPKGSISQSEFDNLNAALLGAKAQVEAGNAQLNLAKVNLSYTQIRAPFSGRISQSKVSTGDLVSPQSGILTTLVSLDPVHTRFSISERERLAMGIDRMKGGGSADVVEVQVVLENGQHFEHLGQLDFLGNRIDLNTGTIAMRAQVPNPDYRLLPGQHIRVELREKQPTDVVVVPRRAVQADLEGNFVMVVAEGNIAERRNVELGRQLEEGIIVTSGVNIGDQVITQGLQRVRNGAPVRINENTDVE
ncbi:MULTISPECIES: efflux RND transporter periplasmic adaptor subunit [Vibrio]|uniref:efflux RND transporter periplasmic adaptor subunit n=1 Tax=Vibrio TaxID=662 RepID=UPI00207629E4|nr:MULTISPECIES: efflux RND transporter periplasmic adaptor subunit [Vibrio]USD35262.1 efflux RND transporter periplasmic adaptor subunit [Vibrio sp. SCSIO 43186]USD48329.1 efflux RND transporter periplasmic adaptor subunit [Vibrio sp. SCSIO 43145]USD72387.1 efflux RND transporter periplasmic adaptor subunit [Vibrio sp. SCSIO 43139]USD98064.1 efflux transporter periplasmic adaptor subunit [Vibrio coralliilyticus]